MKIRMRDGTGTRDYRYVVEDVDRHGNVRIYVRRPGRPKVRLLETTGTAAFDAEYRRAFEVADPIPGSIAPPAVGGHAPGTLNWLKTRYLASSAFTLLHEDTRKVRLRILDAICKRAGTYRYSQMEPRHVAKLRDQKAATPEAANSYVKTLRVLFKWACLPENGYATRNPAIAVGYLKSNNPAGHKPWPEEAAEKYEAQHPTGTRARLAFDVIQYTGVRVSDLVRLGPPMERNGKLVFIETKGKNRTPKEHELPILPPLRASIDATPTGLKFYLVTATGHPYSPKGFGNWFARRCREAGLEPGLTAHGIRKLAAARSATNGGSENQMMAIFGWTTGKEAARYTRSANRKKLEEDAAPSLLPVRSNTSVPLSSRRRAGGTVLEKKP